MIIPQSIQDAAKELSALPGIGPRTAQRLAFFLLKRPDIINDQLAESISKLQKTLSECTTCQNFTESNPCAICQDPSRDQAKLCIVESPIDAYNTERTSYQGRYFILHGALSPIDGITPAKLKIPELIDLITRTANKLQEGRNPDQETKLEIILATNPTMEGEATASYIQKHLENITNIQCTRLARGLPMGADLEHIDEVTLERAFQGREGF